LDGKHFFEKRYGSSYLFSKIYQSMGSSISAFRKCWMVRTINPPSLKLEIFNMILAIGHYRFSLRTAQLIAEPGD